MNYSQVLKQLNKESDEELKRYKTLPPSSNENVFDKLYIMSEENEKNGYNFIRVELTKKNIKFVYSTKGSDLSHKVYIDFVLDYYRTIYDGSFETIFYLNIGDQTIWGGDFIVPIFLVSKSEREHGFIIPHAWTIQFPDNNRKNWIPISNLANKIKENDIPFEEKQNIFLTTATPNSEFRRLFLKQARDNKLIKVVDTSKHQFMPIYNQYDYKFKLILPGVRSWTVGMIMNMLSNSLIVRLNETRIFAGTVPIFAPYSYTVNVIGYGDRILSKYIVEIEVVSLTVKYRINKRCIDEFNNHEVKKAIKNINYFFGSEYKANEEYYKKKAKDGKKVASILLLTDVAKQNLDHTLKIYTKYFKKQIDDEFKVKRRFVYLNKTETYSRHHA